MRQLFTSDSQIIGGSALVSVLLMNTQGWFLLRLTGLISLLSKGFSGVFSSTTFKGINSLALCLLYGTALTVVHDHLEDHSLDYMTFCQQSDASAFQHTVWMCHYFSAKKQFSSDFMSAVTILSDFRNQEAKICHWFHFFSFYLTWSNGARCHDLSSFNI